ncbi:uncharacterized protein LOC116290865 [Actinia tenebrosa]|uniref:Uncharacterized protein LOC116290865 n=1 Tax=Actinia tenebrosa TaxID=6105 RepID=A0A6P8HMG5_ACTTE|nr:uncharacterized protein LOC116290865 [Actinia tenebrosa]XP_031553840.1 uncharacterized protein LOC116290865 [Actinia tenebrosa]XP_031553841.1 uncharacterized protein LOC116290865 [Actinia tenebrosa]XP_031553842.1 uncharacterized protein LOC116290865 [Actinia tenebrosa]XP_031553843.1 uncharacterized protein LOC116290865 [Actinia tenebrosa]XP_031553844.1 uncharacterized protein LOC116290865 [Actinia tenebrosa]XP_031553845.1 uncharacterized protein LOC116290865 [Actinia tenebrosa]XP_03155384
MRLIKTLRCIFLFLLAVVFITVVFQVVFPSAHFFPKLLSFSKVNYVTGHQVSSYPCHYTRLKKPGLGKRSEDYEEEEIACKPHIPSTNSCLLANKAYGSPREILPDVKCDTKSYPNICHFKDRKTLTCSLEICGKTTVFMGRRDLQYGHVNKWEAIEPFNTKNASDFVQTTMQQGETFCLMKCGSILQVLVFPPKIHLNASLKADDKVNVNIVVFDSISRPHFYRMLRKSIAVMRDIVNNGSIPTVFDFERFQSLSMHTMENIRPLFSGVAFDLKDINDLPSLAKAPLGINVLYGHYKRHGYQTMFQEDMCFYDRWGCVLDGIKMKGDSKATAEKWTDYQNIVSKHHIDHFGITHFSCEVFKTFGATNHLEDPDKVCFNGKHFSSYFLDYLIDVMASVTGTKDASPLMSYVHFNTGHTHSGKRIHNVDVGLAKFISSMARDSNTWTILMSDHGHKSTSYGGTPEGLIERYQPFLFMIVPQNVARVLGKQKMDILEANQRRPLTTLDLHRALMVLHDKDKSSSRDHRVSGMFSKIPANRMCNDMPLMPLARCQCEGSDERYEDNSPRHKWLAEFALGTLNNLIQKQFSEGKEAKAARVKGYGRCIRLIGTSIDNIIQSKSGSLVSFDLHVNGTSVGLNEDEIFKVAIALNNGVPTLKTFARQTMYNKFKYCVDQSVDIKMCVCDRRKKKEDFVIKELKKQQMKALISSTMFGSTAKIKDIFNGCLYQIIREHLSGNSLVYEFANSCNETFSVTVKGSSEFVTLTQGLPMTIGMEPNTIKFVFAATKQVFSHSYMNFYVDVKVL